MATATISGIAGGAISAANFTDSAKFEVEDSAGHSKYATLAQVRTAIDSATARPLGSDASGANAAATSVTIKAPRSTGNATPATLIFQTAHVGASSSTSQTLETIFTLGDRAITAAFGFTISTGGLTVAAGTSAFQATTTTTLNASGAVTAQTTLTTTAGNVTLGTTSGWLSVGAGNGASNANDGEIVLANAKSLRARAGSGSTTSRNLISLDSSNVVQLGDGPNSIHVTVGGNLIVSGTLTGVTQVVTTSTGILAFSNRGGLKANSDGVFQLFDDAATSFGRLQFGGSTSSFPSIARSGAGIQIQLADNSGTAGLTCAAISATSGTFSSTGNAIAVGPGSGTTAVYSIFSNGTGNTLIGTDNSAGGIVAGGSYASFFGSNANLPTVIIQNSAPAITISTAKLATFAAGGSFADNVSLTSGKKLILDAGTGNYYIDYFSAGGTLRLFSNGTNFLSSNGTSISITADCMLLTAASTTNRPGIRIPSGTAPSSLTTGDFWYDGTNLKFRDGSTTRTLTWT